MMINIHSVRASGTVYIRSDGSIDPPTAPILTDGSTYTLIGDIFSDSGDGIVIERNNIMLDGAGHIVQGMDQIYTKGIGIRPGKNNVIIKNMRIRSFEDGIFIWSSSNTRIVGNDIRDNVNGITFKDSWNNTIAENNIAANNWIGIMLESSSNNHIYHNSFNNPRRQAVISLGGTSVWNDGYPSGGNYWSNYNGVDRFRGLYQNITGNDGIGDTFYAIDADNRDNFPLMQPWVPPDVGIKTLLPNRTVAYTEHQLEIDVIFQNQGNIIQSFNFTISVNNTVLQTDLITLTGKQSAVWILAWTPAAVSEYQHFVIVASVKPVPGEMDLTDNFKASSLLTIAHAGDNDADGKIDVSDLARTSSAFGSLRITNIEDSAYGQYQHPSPCLRCPHSSNIDVNSDGKIDVEDLSITSAKFGWHR
jgi:parallel beta-helix repeat protein